MTEKVSVHGSGTTQHSVWTHTQPPQGTHSGSGEKIEPQNLMYILNMVMMYIYIPTGTVSVSIMMLTCLSLSLVLHNMLSLLSGDPSFSLSSALLIVTPHT